MIYRQIESRSNPYKMNDLISVVRSPILESKIRARNSRRPKLSARKNRIHAKIKVTARNVRDRRLARLADSFLTTIENRTVESKPKTASRTRKTLIVSSGYSYEFNSADLQEYP